MSDLQIFEGKFGRIRVVLIDGDPWFIAVDSCRCLDIRTDNAMSTLDDDEKVLITPDHYNTGVWNNAGSREFQDLLSQPRGFYIISESGLYSLILRSRKPEAKEIKRWITHEVLPSIRKKGSYSLIQDPRMAYIERASCVEPYLPIYGAGGKSKGRGGKGVIWWTVCGCHGVKVNGTKARACVQGRRADGRLAGRWREMQGQGECLSCTCRKKKAVAVEKAYCFGRKSD